nr:unnamed protein product [Callosobruchus analis]
MALVDHNITVSLMCVLAPRDLNLIAESSRNVHLEVCWIDICRILRCGRRCLPLKTLFDKRIIITVEHLVYPKKCSIIIQNLKINCKIKAANKIVLAACALHNFLQKDSSATYLSRGSVDEQDIIGGSVNPGQWRAEITELRRMDRYHES